MSPKYSAKDPLKSSYLYSDAYISSPEHAIFMKVISLDRTVNADLT